jgi:hypothetical protein
VCCGVLLGEVSRWWATLGRAPNGWVECSCGQARLVVTCLLAWESTWMDGLSSARAG